MNIVVLVGTLSRHADRRELASGSVLLTLDLTTPAAGGAATVPVAWFDPPTSSALAAGDDVVVVGTVRRRFFRAGGVTQSRKEVVARSVVRATQRKQVARLLAGVAADVGAGPGVTASAGPGAPR